MSASNPVPREVLVVGWFPSADDTSAGRFVADQVAALAATGMVRPSVVAFENAVMRGPGPLRDRQAAAVSSNAAAAIVVRSPFAPRGAAGPAGVPVARLGVAAGETPATGPDHRALHRTAVLQPLMERIGEDGWDLVHAHVGYPAGAAAAGIATRLDRPFVITEHASYLASLLDDTVVRERYRDATRAAARVIAVSGMLATEMARIVPELEGRIVIIPNTVAVEAFGGGTPEERVPGELLWVGARIETKGIATLLRAFAIVHERAPHAVLRMIGRASRPGQEDGWRRQAAGLGIADVVRFEPPADRAGVAAAMRRADLFVHPSPRETFGVVAVEALASGLPVIAADSGGVTEVLGKEPARFGAIVAAGDPTALAAAVLGAMERRAAFDPELLRAYAVEHFGSARVAQRLVALYEEVLAEHPRGIAATDARRQPTGRADGGGAGLPLVAGRPSRTVIVGFSRLELERAIARFPAWVTEGAVLVTCGGPIDGRPNTLLASPGTESAVAELLDWGAAPTGRAGRFKQRLRRAGRRLRTRMPGQGEAPERRLLHDLARTLAAALPPERSPEAPPLVCLGGLDHLVAAPFIASGRAVPAPGGLGWLADRRAADQAMAAAPASSDA